MTTMTTPHAAPQSQPKRPATRLHINVEIAQENKNSKNATQTGRTTSTHGPERTKTSENAQSPLSLYPYRNPPNNLYGGFVRKKTPCLRNISVRHNNGFSLPPFTEMPGKNFYETASRQSKQPRIPQRIIHNLMPAHHRVVPLLLHGRLFRRRTNRHFIKTGVSKPAGFRQAGGFLELVKR